MKYIWLSDLHFEIALKFGNYNENMRYVQGAGSLF